MHRIKPTINEIILDELEAQLAIPVIPGHQAEKLAEQGSR